MDRRAAPEGASDKADSLPASLYFLSFALLPDKTWFIVLLVGGLLGLTFSFGLLGFAAMVAYLVAGPDGMTGQQP